MGDAEADRQRTQDKYEYFRGLSLEEINAHLTGLNERIEGVKGHYTGLIGRRRTRIRDEDMQEVMEAFGDLLPMTTNPEVQQEALDAMRAGMATQPQDLTVNRITGLIQSSMLFVAGFENSGVTAIGLGGETVA